MDQSSDFIHRGAQASGSTTACIPIDGKNFELRELENRLKYGVEKCRIKDMTQLAERMGRTEERIQQYEDEDRKDIAEQERRYLNELKTLQVLREQISVKYAALLSKNIDQLELSELETRLRYSLDQCRIKDVTQLTERLRRTEKRIVQYEDEERVEAVEQEMRYMRDLEQLQRIIEEVFFRRSTEQMVKNDLKHLPEEFAHMPCCAEKTILELLTYFQQKSLKNYIDETAPESVTQRLGKLQEQIQREELCSEQIRTSLQDLNRVVHNEDGPSTVRVLKKILRQIRPLHVLEIQRLMEKTKNTAALISDRDVILLVGITGSGKSTTIQFLAGAKMKETLVEIAPGKFLEHITVDGPVRNAGLKSVTSSPLSRSETRSIVPVTVQLQDIIGAHQTGEIILCDAPGFGDTDGPEIDIANSIGVIAALKNCRSVKILALSSYRSLGDRGEGIQKLARILIRMIDGIEDRLYGIVYAFTKYPPETDIHAVLSDIKTSKVDADPILRSDKAFVTVITDMIAKTKDSAEKIDPIHGDPTNLIRKLKALNGICYPGEVFRFSMSEETQGTILDQVQKYQLRIRCVMKRKDTELVMHYMNNLKVLNDLIKQDSVCDAYGDTIRFLSENIRQYCTEMMEQLSRHLVSQDGLRDEDIRAFKTADDFIQQLQILREHLGSNLVSADILIKNMLVEMEKRSLALREEELDSPAIRVFLDNFRLLQNSVKELESHYQKTCQDLAERFESKLVKSVPERISSNEFKQVAEIMSAISKCLPVLNHHLNGKIKESYRAIVSSVLQHLNRFSEDAHSVLSKITLNHSDIEILQNYITLLKSAKSDISIQTVKDLNQVYDDFIDKVSKHFEEINLRIKEVFQKSGNHALEHIEQSVIQMEMIRTIADIESKTARPFWHTIENIRGYMQQWQREAEELLPTLDQPSGVINVRPLTRSLARLKYTQWIDRIVPETYNSLMRHIREEVTERADRLEIRWKKLDLDLKYPQNLLLAQEIFEKIESMKGLEQSIPELKPYRDRINQSFVQTTKEVFDYIQKTFNLADKTTNNLKQELIELEQLKKQYDQLYPARIFLRKSGYADIHVLNGEIDNLKIREEVETEKYQMESQNVASPRIDLRLVERLFAKIGIGFQRRQTDPNDYSKQTLINLESIKKEYHSLISPKENDFLQEKGQTSYELLEKTIDEKKTVLTEFEQNRHYFCEKLDAGAANNSLIYITNCEKVGQHDVRERAAETEEWLKKYLEEYGYFLDKEIEKNFKHITRIDESDPRPYSDVLEKYLEELFSFDKNVLVFENVHGAETIERWHRQFFNYHRSLENQMEEYKISGRNQEFRKLLIIAQALSCIDRFCTAKLADNGFRTLYRHYQTDAVRGSREAYDRAIVSISKGDYANTDLALSDVVNQSSSSKFLTQIKSDLQHSLNKMMKDTKSCAYWFDGKIERQEDHRDKIREINENMGKIRLVVNRHRLIELLDDPTKSALQKFEQEMSQILSTAILNAIKNIELFMDGNSFLEAEQCMENLMRAQRGLAGDYTSKLVDVKVEEMKTRLRTLPDNILKSYDFADLNNYPINPPTDILAQLKRVASGGYARYIQVPTAFMEKIRVSFTLAIEKVCNNPFYDPSTKIRSIKHAFLFLPEELKMLFQSQIDELNVDENASLEFD